MKTIKIECPTCQQHIEIDTADPDSKSFPAFCVFGLVVCAISFCFGYVLHIDSSREQVLAAASIPESAAKEIPLPNPSPVVPVPAPVPPPPIIVETPIVGGFGWTLGQKLPAQCQTPANSYLDPKSPQFLDDIHPETPPFNRVSLTCLSDRTIYRIIAYCSDSVQFEVVLAALCAKYGQSKVGSGDLTISYSWHHGDTELSISEGHDADGFVVAYESDVLTAKHQKQLNDANAAAGAQVMSHL